ncbi:hypothetical protein Clacol_008006 [Clathrus columnatus]|uniref:Uncharacterized protein n=1 Tax=Clathrus columnatus TaxID=1419009 RepID=A0AAV5APB3_9AGAM|nr:hypothetical protein Clacol_008006 [Clathrus columnatus]
MVCTLPFADRHLEESERLTYQFKVAQEFIGGLTFAPAETIQPKKILVLGSGTGALAADSYPPMLGIKETLHFERFDLGQPLLWQSEPFDVIHSRLTSFLSSNIEGIGAFQ